jgi:cytochrome P450 PksS
MRTEAPVYFSKTLNCWILTRYEDVASALKDERLSADRRSLFAAQIGDLDPGSSQNFLQLHGNMMLEQDPPEHSCQRKVANHGFTPKALEGWRAIVQDTADRLLDRVQDNRKMDVVVDLSVPLPALTIADIFGAPAGDRENLIRWASEIGTFWGAPDGKNIEEITIEEIARKADRSSARFRDYIMELVDERRRNPSTDMLGLLTTAYTCDKLDLEELPSLCILILNAGHLTTTDLIPNGVSALLRNPEQWEKLQAHPELLDSAIEEMICFDTAAPFVFRIAKVDSIVGDQYIPIRIPASIQYQPLSQRAFRLWRWRSFLFGCRISPHGIEDLFCHSSAAHAPSPVRSGKTDHTQAQQLSV